ncbi:MAG TPA: hypothetical protein DD621_05425 [Clostridiales bacterium]|nr:hypothetical protein [Clostridiales bacterium]
MAKRNVFNFKITVTFNDGLKLPYEELMKLDKIILKAEDNLELLRDFDLTFNMGFNERRQKQKRLNEIYRKKQIFKMELKRVEDSKL